MDKIRPLEGITSEMVQTQRLNTHILTSGLQDGTPVIFLHGNFSAATYWEETMLALPQGFRAIAPDLRGYGWTEDKLIDATRGMRDWSDDLDALFVTLNIERAHVVGWSLGGGVVYRFLIDHPEKVLSATLVCPVSPYGFGGTKDLKGTPCYDCFSGSGGGTVNPEFVKRIKDGDRSDEDPNSPRNVINAFYYVPPFRAAREEDFLTASLMEKIGDDRYPGDLVASDNWPNVAPGVKGPINAGSPKYVLDDVPALIATQPKPPILWVRGSDDMIVSDNSMFDFGTLGKMDLVPGWPGDDVFPPQPMVSQTRAVLEQYASEGGAVEEGNISITGDGVSIKEQYAGKGGTYQEHFIPGTAHAPQIEKPEEFNAIFHTFLAG